MAGLRVESALATDVGIKRTENQDSGLIARAPSAAMANMGGLFIVADGMGGHAGGQQASQLAVAVVSEAYYRADGDEAATALQTAANDANARIRGAAAEHSELDNMGSTLVAAAYRGQDLTIGHVGDSRAYLLHEGQLRLLTRDHSFVAELVAAGRITTQEARSHPQRNVVTRSLGVSDELDLEIDRVQPADGDVLLLCSDGLWDQVGEEQIAHTLQTESLARAARTLVRLANENGGADNITALIVSFRGSASAFRGLLRAFAVLAIILGPVLIAIGAVIIVAAR